MNPNPQLNETDFGSGCRLKDTYQLKKTTGPQKPKAPEVQAFSDTANYI
jgi:hypothetical protein